METPIQNENAILLEEVFQLLLESLDHDPFSQKSGHASKKHIARLRELLGQEFSFWLAETGNIYFSTLISAKKFADEFFSHSANEDKPSKQVYDLLLHTSQTMMCVGPHSEQTINVVIKLQTLTIGHKHITNDIAEIIENTVIQLRNCFCKRIFV